MLYIYRLGNTNAQFDGRYFVEREIKVTFSKLSDW